MIKGIAHVCLSSADLADAERFYCEALGFSRVFDFVRDGCVIGFYLEVAPGSYIEVFKADDVDTGAKAPIRHFCLEVDDLEAVRQRLMQYGYDATEKKLGNDRSWQAWTTDPGGVRIEFHQYTERSSQITGENCVLK